MVKKLLGIVLLAACAPKPLSSIAVATTGNAKARIIVMCQGIVTKESGPKESVQTFGETYAFNPATFAVRRDEPTQIIFWNLQPDDEHDVMLLDEHNHVVLQRKLPPLSKISYVMTFHRQGVFPFFCTMHQPEMSGQVLVLSPSR